MAGKKYTRSEVVDSVTKKTGMNQKDVRIVIDCLLDDLKVALIERKIIEIRGFGTFEVRVRKGKEKARNPKTGALVSVDAHGIATFRPGKELKKDVWNLVKEDEVSSSKESDSSNGSDT